MGPAHAASRGIHDRRLVVTTMTREDLAALRTELLADLAARQRRESEDPFYDPPPARQSPPLVQKSAGNGELTYSTRENALAPAPEPADDTPDGIDPILFEGISEALALLRGDIRREFERKLAKRDAEIAELRGKLDALSATRSSRKSRA